MQSPRCLTRSAWTPKTYTTTILEVDTPHSILNTSSGAKRFRARCIFHHKSQLYRHPWPPDHKQLAFSKYKHSAKYWLLEALIYANIYLHELTLLYIFAMQLRRMSSLSGRLWRVTTHICLKAFTKALVPADPNLANSTSLSGQGNGRCPGYVYRQYLLHIGVGPLRCSF